MPQSDLPGILAVASDIVVALSAVIVAAVAGIGLKRWRDEIEGRARFDLARTLSRLAMEFRDRYHRVRVSPALPHRTFFLGTGSRARTSLEALAEQYQSRGAALDNLASTLLALKQAGWEADSLFHTQASIWIEGVERRYNELERALSSYFSIQMYRAEQGAELINESEWGDDRAKVIFGHREDDWSKTIDLEIGRVLDEIEKLWVRS